MQLTQQATHVLPFCIGGSAEGTIGDAVGMGDAASASGCVQSGSKSGQALVFVRGSPAPFVEVASALRSG